MEIDAISERKTENLDPSLAFCKICIQRGLFYRCLEKFETATHMVNGERRLLNKISTVSKKFTLLKPTLKEDSHQIAAI